GQLSRQSVHHAKGTAALCVHVCFLHRIVPRPGSRVQHPRAHARAVDPARAAIACATLAEAGMRTSALFFCVLSLASCKGEEPGGIAAEDSGAPSDDATLIDDRFDIAIPTSPCAWPHVRSVEVGSSDELTNALASAEPGDLIKLDNAIYGGPFEA